MLSDPASPDCQALTQATAGDATPASIAERGPVDQATFEREILPSYRPIVLRGQFQDWPAVQAGLDGHEALAAYLLAHSLDSPIQVMIGQPNIKGRFFYNEDLDGVNFVHREVRFMELIAELLRLVSSQRPPALYAGSSATNNHFDAWEQDNASNISLPEATARIWIGNAISVATHFDTSNNLACVVGGERRFTLFPPTQIENLYVGPLEMTLAGQPTSMVNLDCPDFERYPRFSEALRFAQSATLGPGDAIFIPALWWHHVASMSPFNVLVNYWSEPAGRVGAFPAMVHALLAIRELDPNERAAWKHWFDHYVFQDRAAEVANHLPVTSRGVLGQPTAARAAKILAYLTRALSRS